MKKAQLWTLLKIAVAGGLFATLLFSIDFLKVVDSVSRGNRIGLVTGSLGLLMAGGVQVVRFHVLSSRLASSWKTSLEVTLVGMFFNQLLPTNLGGDGYRVVRLRSLSKGWSSAIGLIFLERIIGSLVILVPGFLYCVGYHERLLQGLQWSGVDRLGDFKSAVLLVAVGGSALVLVVAVGFLGRRFRYPLSQVFKSVMEVARGISSRQYVGLLSLSVLYHGLRLGAFGCLLSSLGARWTTLDLVFVLSFVLLVSFVPTSFGALGLKEGAMVAALGLFGVRAADAFAVALVNRGALVTMALCGGAIMLRKQIQEAGGRPG